MRADDPAPGLAEWSTAPRKVLSVLTALTFAEPAATLHPGRQRPRTDQGGSSALGQVWIDLGRRVMARGTVGETSFRRLKLVGLPPPGIPAPPPFQPHPSPTSPSLGSLVPEGSRSQEPGEMHCANILTLFVSVREPHRHIQVKRSLNKRRQPSQCKNKYPSSGRSSSCAAPQVPSAAPNNYKSVQRECVGVSVNGCALGGTVERRAKSELQTIGQGRGAALREALATRGRLSAGAPPAHTHSRVRTGKS